MTRFSDPDVHQCPDCKGYLLWSNLKSFNTFGIATTWSDGAAPLQGMLDGSIARTCPACGAVLWKKDLAVLGTLTSAPPPVHPVARKLAQWFGDRYGLLRAEDDWAAVPDAWKEAARVDWLDYPDMQRALLTARALDPDRELFLRRRIWWKTNDHIRRHPDGSRVTEEPVAPEPDRRANMLRMIALLEAANSGLAERAELLRHVGQFEDAIGLLTSGRPEIRRSATAAWTLRWARAGDTDVKTFTNVPTLWSEIEDAAGQPENYPSEATVPAPGSVW